MSRAALPASAHHSAASSVQPPPAPSASSFSVPLSSPSASTAAAATTPTAGGAASWSSVSLAGLTLDSFSFDSFDPSGAPPHPEANPSGLRSDAEIAAFALPEQLTEVDRLLALLQSPHSIQRRSAATQLVCVLHGESNSSGDVSSGGGGGSGGAAAVRELFAGVVRLLSELDCEAQTEVSDALAECADRGFVSQQLCMEVLLPALLQYLTPGEWAPTNNSAAGSPSPSNASSAPSPSSASTFGSSASAAAATPRGPQIAPCVAILRHLLAAHSSLAPLLSALSTFAEKSADSIHSSSRLVSAQLIGLLAPHMSTAAVTSLLPSFLPLCQDTSLDVRAAMSGSVCRLAEAVRGSLPSLQSIVTELSELLRDEEFAVKEAALLGSVSVLPLLSPSLLSSSLLPVFRSYLSSPPRPLHSTLARVLGQWCVSCGPSLSSDARVVREFYRSSSVSGDNDVRYWCVYNLPAMVSLLAPISSASAPSALFDVAFLAPLLTSFCHDPHPPVRLSLSHSLCVVGGLLLRVSSQHMRLLKDLLVTLLRDGEVSVRANILSSIPALLATPAATTASTSAPAATPSSSSPSHTSKVTSSVLPAYAATSAAAGSVDAAVLTDIFRAMLAVDFSSLSYRHRMLYLDSLYSLRLHFTSHDMQYLYYDRLTPLLFASLHATPPLPLLRLLLSFLCHFLSSLPSSQRRHDLLLRLLRLYCPTSRSCYDRIVFVRLVEEMAQCFSRRWMRKHALPLASKMLQSEAVREVKLRLMAVLGSRPALKCMDAKEREHFSKWVQALTADGDRHTIEKAAEFSARRPFDRGEKGATADEKAADDEEDRRDRDREEREDRLLRDEEELMEAMMRKEQVRERNVLLSSSAGSQTNNAVMLLMMKQKKEREKELKGAASSNSSRDKDRDRDRDRDDRAAAAGSAGLTQLAPVTPQHSKAATGGKLSASNVSRTGRVRGGSDKGVANVPAEEKDGGSKRDDKDRNRDEDDRKLEAERKERGGRQRGYFAHFPGLSPAASAPSSSFSSSLPTPMASPALRSPSSLSSSPPPSSSKRAAPLLPSAAMHPMSRRFPTTTAAAAPQQSPTASPSTVAAASTLSTAQSALPSALSTFIPALTHSGSGSNGSPRLVKLSSSSSTASRPQKVSNATVAAGGGGYSRRT